MEAVLKNLEGFCPSEKVSGFGEDAFVVALVGGDDVVGAVVFLGVDAGDFAHFAAAVGAGQDFDGVACGCFDVAGFHQKTIHAVRDDLGHAANVCGDDGDFAGHGFESGEAEGFELRRKQKEIGGGEFFVDVVLFAQKKNVFLQAILADEEFGGAAVRAVADENELGGHFGADEGEDFHDVREALHGAKIRKMHQDGFAAGSPLRAETLVGDAVVEVAIHEVGDDFDGTLDVEVLKSFLQKIVRDGGDAVALLDGKFGDGKIAAVAADQGDVRAMKGGDEGKATRRG